MSENELFFRQISRKMYKNVHRMQSENLTDKKVDSPRPETERYGLDTCLFETSSDLSFLTKHVLLAFMQGGNNGLPHAINVRESFEIA
jgi:hypothetical protein